MKTTINKKLQLTPEEYEMLFFDTYFRWCESVTITAREFQKVLANAAINRWYRIEFAKCEAEFEHLTSRYEGHETVTSVDFKKCYATCTVQMFNIRPMALLHEAKKTEVKPSTTLVRGIAIPFSIVNLN